MREREGRERDNYSQIAVIMITSQYLELCNFYFH